MRPSSSCRESQSLPTSNDGWEPALQEFCLQPAARDVLPTPRRPLHRRFVRASVAASLAAVVLAALFVAFDNQDAWGQVAKAMRAKPWVRWTFRVPKDMPVPEGFQAPEGWFSAEKKVFAGRANQSVHYIDLADRETYDYQPQTNTLYRAFPSDIDNVEAGHFETLLRLVSEWDRAAATKARPILPSGSSSHARATTCRTEIAAGPSTRLPAATREAHQLED